MSAGGTLAVIIPAFNAAATLDACLSAICASTRKPDEVIVFDDGSIDDTGARAKRHGATLISHYGASLGPAEGRNRASRKTAAEILVFIDADVEVHVDAIARLETEILSSPEIAAAFGSYDDAPHCTRIAALYANLRHHFVHQQAESDAATFWSGLGAIRGDAFQAVDGFDNRFRRPSIEDIELGARLKQSGLRIRLVAAAQAKHWKNWTLIQLWRVDIFRRAVPWSRLIVSGQTSGLNLNLSIRERLSSALAHGLWIWGGVSLIWPALWTAFAVTAAAYVLINARFFGLLWRKGGPALLLGGGLLQLCYHLYASATFACVVVVDWIELAAISLAPRWIKRRHDHLRRPAPARIEREDRVLMAQEAALAHDAGAASGGERSSSHPEVSIIIPTWNRPERLAECLDALCALEHPSFEVVVVDDGSDPPIAPVAVSFANRLQIVSLRQNNAGPASARNLGAAAARGRILAFTDDDCRPQRDWLRRLAGAVAAAPDAIAGGGTSNALKNNIHSEVSQDLVSFLYARAEHHPGGFDFFTSNNMACLKQRFMALGGFDETFPLAAGEDRDFGLRWKRAGGRMIYARDAIVAHHHVLTVRGFWRQQSNYGRGAHHLRQRFRARRERVIPFAGLRFYVEMLIFPFRTRRSKPLIRSALLVASQLAMTAGLLENWLRSRTGAKRL